MVFDMLDEICEAHWSNVMVVQRRTFLNIEIPYENAPAEQGLVSGRARAFTDSALHVRAGDGPAETGESDDELEMVDPVLAQSFGSSAPTECLEETSGGESVINDGCSSVCSFSSVDQEDQAEYELRQEEGGAAAIETTPETLAGSSWVHALWVPAAMGGVWGYSIQMAVGGAPEQNYEHFESPAASSSPLTEPAVAKVGRWADCEDDEAALPRAAYPEWHPMRTQMQVSGAGSDHNNPHTLDCLLPDERTTVMFKSVPIDWTRDHLAEVLDAEGFCAEYDFVHVPVRFQDSKNSGYALVNLTSNSSADGMLRYFEGFEVAGGNRLEMSWSNEKQGLAAHVERYRDSPMMHSSVPEQYQPGLFRDGVRLPFPAPTKNLRAPRVRRQKWDAAC